MTMTITNDLTETIYSTARFYGSSAAFATRVDQIEETLTLQANGRALPTVVVGGTGTGKTALLKSIARGATAANYDVATVNARYGDSRVNVEEALVLANTRSAEMAERGLRAGEAGFRPHMLLVDDLQSLSCDMIDVLHELSQVAGKTNINLIVATQSLDVSDGFAGDPALQANLTAGNVVRLCKDKLRVPGTGVSGEDGTSFRVWYPGA